MYSVVVRGFKTKAQAEEFIFWYCGAGEQSSVDWFEARKSEGDIDVDSMVVDNKTFPIAWKENQAEMLLSIDG